MPIVRKAAVICDRCGAKQEFDPKSEHPLMSGFSTRGTPLEGWCEVDGGKCLCAACTEEHAAIVERHRRELREFMGVNAVEFEI